MQSASNSAQVIGQDRLAIRPRRCLVQNTPIPALPLAHALGHARPFVVCLDGRVGMAQERLHRFVSYQHQYTVNSPSGGETWMGSIHTWRR